MAFATKTDFSGLAANPAIGSSLTICDDAQNLSVETYAPQGQDGSIVAIEVYGEDEAPTNNFAVKADIDADDGDVKLNSVTTVGGKKYALESFEITTGAGVAPSISATSQLVESTATDATQCLYEVPAFALSTKHHAQILFSAFTLTGTGCELTACNASLGGTINKDKVEGVIVGSDINSGLITVSGTILQTGTTAPTITPATGWKLTQPPNCTNPEAQYKSYAFELQKPLVKTHPSS